MVLDRPNPIGGDAVEGPTLRPGFESFVGAHPIPIRHGLTVGELARLYRAERRIDVELEVVACEGLRRDMDWDATGLPWVLPSPNMPTVDTAFVYPGQCLIEGTNLSEGRGTTRPFELCGGPGRRWPRALRAAQHGKNARRHFPAGVVPADVPEARRTSRCGGVQLHVTDRDDLPVGAGRRWRCWRLCANGRCRLRVADRRHTSSSAIPIAIDLLFGSDRERIAIEAGRLGVRSSRRGNRRRPNGVSGVSLRFWFRNAVRNHKEHIGRSFTE